MLGRLFLTGILGAVLVLAQGMGGMGGGGGRGMSDGGGMGDSGRGSMDSPTMTASRPSRFDEISQILKLNKDQKKEVKNILDEAQKQATPLHDQITKKRDTIGDAIQAGKNQDEINQMVTGEAALEGQMAAIEMKAFARIFKSLDKDQQANTGQVFQMMKGLFNGKSWNTEE